MAAIAAGDAEKLKVLTDKNYRSQAVWFLNAFWDDVLADDKEKNKIYEYTQLMTKLDPKGKDGNELDEFKAHQFLEKTEGALTVAQMRKELKEIDIDFNKHVALTEFLIFNYKVDVHALVIAPQTSDAEASRNVQAAQVEVDKAMAQANVAKEAADAAAAAHAAAVEAEEAAKKALADLEAEQKAFDDKCAKFEETGNNMELGIVKRNRAKQELAQLKASDPMPLQRAKITQSAAVRKVAKARKKAETTANAAKEEHAKAEESFKNAEENLALLTKQCKGAGQGTMWYMKRELAEAKKYMTPKQLKKSDEELLKMMA